MIELRPRLAAARSLLAAARSLGLRATLEKTLRRWRDNGEYRRWLRVRQAQRPASSRAAVERVERAGGPLFSVLMPTCEAETRWLSRAIASVRAQHYPRWELCIADDASTSPGVRRTLEEASRGDARIRVAFRPSRGHISAASNSALALARGEFVALLDHDDELEPFALDHLAAVLLRCRNADLVYSDEDKLDLADRRRDAYFKPDFSPDLLLSQNLVSHLAAYRTALVQRAGGFREGFEGAQDHDLALRVLELSSPPRFAHVPHVLYHWRATPESASGGLWRKEYAHVAGCRAIAEHLERTGRRATVERALYSAYRVRYALPEPAPAVTVLAALPVLDGIARAGPALPADLIAVDGSAGLAGALDEAVRRAEGAVVVVLGAGCQPEEGWLEELVSQAARPDVAVAGGRVVSPRGRVLHAGYLVALEADPPVLDAHAGCHEDAPGHFGRARLVQNLTAVGAECMAFRREIFLEAGGFDAAAFPGGLFDVDFCLRASRFGRIVFTPFAKVVRRVARRRRSAAGTTEERQQLRTRWRDSLPRDPYWHPELDRRQPDFRLAL